MGGAVAPTTSTSEPIFQRKNLRPAFLCSIAVLGAVLYGYDGTYFTGILGQSGFNRDFAQDGKTELSPSMTSLLTSLVQAGEVVGCILAAFIGDWAGRKGVFFAAATGVGIGAIFQIATTSSIGVFATGRAILGVGIGLVANGTPLYLSEIAPTSIRSIAVSCWQLLLAIGQVIGAAVNQGTKDIDSTAAYRIPIGLNLLIVLLIFLGLLVLPESPRWLIYKGREDAALKSLRRINKGAPDVAEIVQREFALFKQAKEDEEALNSDGENGWKTMFKGVELRKFLCTFGILVCQQIGGVQFIFSYTTTFLQAINIEDPFLITIIVDIIEVVGVICSFFIVNRLGRRTLLLWTSVPMFISLFVCGGIGTITSGERTVNESRTIAAMICVYVFFFNVAWGPLAWVVASELSTGKNKSKHLGVGTAGFFVIAWAVTFTLPYLFYSAGLNAQIGWIYGVGTLFAMAFVYFCIPETRGRSLEEISEMMDARVPTRQWASYIASHSVSNSVVQHSSRDSSSGGSEDEESAPEKKGAKRDIEPLSAGSNAAHDGTDGTRTELRDA
ncbi:general substrate transporter [Tilletiaria anomala UBC 951]|uniref:General substrate transporter n=1 Tax=Tilletiaria anomala (strain ATCC 24038 / CBS 436.72 / UBC 951) TaxID=1037660 RepID=A0A066W4V8_TILAU|nr:general substrate transporter [Tilletiaria anomala UBC 951]KDN46114.1 general substrate transporter [Tilletiaria anomala UBC 951]